MTTLPLSTVIGFLDENTLNRRYTPDDFHFLSLLDSIHELGIKSPIPLSPQLKVLGGRRRLACAVLLGIENIPIVISDMDAIKDNDNTVRMPILKINPTKQEVQKWTQTVLKLGMDKKRIASILCITVSTLNRRLAKYK